MAFLSLKKILDKNYAIVCGLDEVGRGPWAGPLVACALILKKNFRYKGLKDSKKLTAQKREVVFGLLQKNAIYGLGMSSVEEIDQLGLIKANNLAFQRALENMKSKDPSIIPDFLVIDGRDKLKLPYPFKTIIKGDEKIKIIACASIIAKVTRDRLMKELASQYPHYGFGEHKGYGTAAHHRALKKFGVSPIHRRSFKPVQEILYAV